MLHTSAEPTERARQRGPFGLNFLKRPLLQRTLLCGVVVLFSLLSAGAWISYSTRVHAYNTGRKVQPTATSVGFQAYDLYLKNGESPIRFRSSPVTGELLNPLQNEINTMQP